MNRTNSVLVKHIKTTERQKAFILKCRVGIKAMKLSLQRPQLPWLV